MNISEILMSLAPAILVSAVILLIVKKFFDQEKMKRNIELKKSLKDTMMPVRLQAYERIILFLERISPENLLFRVYKQGMSARLLHTELLKNIRLEYEHNLSQQLYVSSMSWDMLKKSKEELIKTIHNSMAKIDPNSNGIELSKQILSQYGSVEKPPITLTIELFKKEVRQLF